MQDYIVYITVHIVHSRRTESTPFSNPLPIDEEQNRDRKQNRCQTAQERHGPVDSEIVELFISIIGDTRA